MENVNFFRLDGDVMEKLDKKSLIVQTVGYGLDGTAYPRLLKVIVPVKAIFDMIVEGAKYRFMGELHKEPQEEATLVATSEETAELAEDAEYYNLGQVVGKLYQKSFTAAKPDKKKPQFINLLVKVGNMLFTGVAFRGLCTTLKADAPEGSELKIGGRLQRRQFSDGSDRFATEIICQEDYTEIVNPVDPTEAFNPTSGKKLVAPVKAKKAKSKAV
jgi:hypothetical protein